MKLTISNTINFQLLFGTYTTNSSAYIMGFNNANTSLALSQLSDNCINLSLPLYICCDITELGISCKTTDNTSTVFVFPNKVNIGDILSYSENTDYKMCARISDRGLRNMQIRFSTSNNVDLDINNADWIMILRLCYC